MEDNYQPDYFGFMMHFVCGAVLGVCLGMWAFIRGPWTDSVSLTPMMIHLVAGGLVTGTIAGMQKEQMWDNLPQAIHDYWLLMIKAWFGVAVILVLAILIFSKVSSNQ